MSKAFSDEELRLALIGYYDAVAEASAPAPGQHFSYSPGHIARMEKLIRRSKNRQRRILTFQRVAAVLLAFLITAATWLAVDVHARESFFTWVRTVYEDHIVYRFHGGSSAAPDELPVYELGWIPKGFELVEEDIDDLSCYKYYSDSSGNTIVLEYESIRNEIAEYYNNSPEAESIVINGCKGELIRTDESSSTNNVFWIDENQGIVFFLNSNLDVEDMIHIAKKLVLR